MKHVIASLRTKSVHHQFRLERTRMAITSISQGMVLVCDDDADTRDVLAVSLERAHYKVCSVSGYDELKHELVSIEPDVILLDICMPDFDGFYVADSLRLLGEMAPIIFITAYDKTDYRISASFVSRVHAYLRKPFDPEELLKLMEQAIKSARKRKQ